MAVEMFLELSGADGESIATGFEGKIEVLAWSWGVSNIGSPDVGGGSGTGKATWHDLSITKYVDKATNTLMKFCAQGKHFATGKMSCRKVGGDTPLTYMVIDLKQVFVTNITHDTNTSDERTRENVTLSFAEMSNSYQPQSQSGSSAGNVPFGWNIRENREAA